MKTQAPSPERSYNMSQVRSRGNLSTEVRMARLLRENGLSGWRRHRPLPGTPDFSWRTARVALFVDGCFWHGCPRCRNLPATNRAFWEAKIEGNKARDRLVDRQLRAKGWRVVRVWEHSLRLRPDATADRIWRALALA